MPEKQSTRVTLAAAAAFAGLSGDYNPLHLDPVAARRTAVGEPVAHGMHLAFAGLEELAKHSTEPHILSALCIRFARPVPVAATVSLDSLTMAEEQFDLSLAAGACRITGSWQAAESALLPSPPPALRPNDRLARRPSFDEAARAAGEHPVYLDGDELKCLFPAIAGRLPALQVAQLLATTRLIAMECPGRETLFDSLELHFDTTECGDKEAALLGYRAVRSDARFSLIELAVEGRGVTGQLRTFYHPDPVAQLSFSEARARVAPHEFAGQRALVVGGSRGAGEATAKLVAAGGGAVRLTYHLGEADARRVVDEIAQCGGDVAAFPLDVVGDVAAALQRGLGDWLPTHIYYYATPRHSPPRLDNELSPQILERFRAYYERGLSRVARFFSARPSARPLPITVLFPSAAFVEAPRPNLRECAMAKQEAERACRALAAALPGWSFHSPRWPLLRTDQNTALAPMRLADPADVVLAALRGGTPNPNTSPKEE